MLAVVNTAMNLLVSQKYGNLLTVNVSILVLLHGVGFVQLPTDCAPCHVRSLAVFA